MKHIKTISERKMIPALTWNCTAICEWKKGLVMTDEQAECKCADKCGTVAG